MENFEVIIGNTKGNNGFGLITIPASLLLFVINSSIRFFQYFVSARFPAGRRLFIIYFI